MRRTASMTSKGQVTVCVAGRRLGLRQGDRVAFDVEDGVATLWPLSAEPNAMNAYVGAPFQERADRRLTLDLQRHRSAFSNLRIEP